ncbi:hypothetical protein D9615_004451 [Tricholomella constricta]|uniref:Uncharacterized protein n=1 Tax=Tricholomella constricta TaxID=117010 RepID=A0A8H5HET3_9AGAR|nr:hypothetical protein D9615_004451 [Tricholomella constricta]
MATTIALRCAVAAASSSAGRVLALRSARPQNVRTVSTSTKEEVDPQLNGYPQLPFVSNQTLPALGWQDPLLRRNFGDTLHEEDEVLSMWGPDIPPVPPMTATLHFLLAASAFVGFGFLVKNVMLQDAPAVRREYPFSGLVIELGGEENKARAESTEED